MTTILSLLQAISPYKPSPANYDSIWAEFFAQNHVVSRVAEVDGVIVGYGAMVIEQKIRGGKLAHVEDIVTRREYMGKGVGRALLEALSVEAFRTGCYKIVLSCSDDNIGFYKRCDFEVGGASMRKFAASG